jgi:hypothetical protein
MYRLVGGALTLLLAMPALWAEDHPKDKSASPAEQYQALLKEYQNATNEFFGKTLRDAKPEDRQKLMAEKNPTKTFSPKFLALAEENPNDPIAVDALIWVLSNGPMDDKGPSAKAKDILVRDHMESDKLGQFCQSLGYRYDKQNEDLLKAILTKNPHKSVQAEAALALAMQLNGRASFDTKVQAECEMAFREFADKFAAALPASRLAGVCQQNVFSTSKGVETLLRRLLEKDTRREVQGVACLSLAQMQKQRANGLPESEANAAKKFQEESEKNFEQAAEKYADVKLPFRGTVGEKAKSELFDLHHLSVGQPAPEVAGVDQDGKKFGLAEYKGKVVLLDFWSQY